MVKKEIIATKYTPSALKIGVKKSEKWEKRQKFPHDLLVLILGRLSLPPDWIWGRKNYLFVLRGVLLRVQLCGAHYYSER